LTIFPQRLERTEILTSGAFWPASSRKTALSLPTPVPHLPALVYWFFLLFILTLPLEAANVGITSGSLSLARLSGLMFFATYVFYYNFLSRKRSFPRLPRAMWGFAGYLVVFALHAFFIPDELATTFFSRLLTLIQLTAFCWIATDLLKDPRVTRHALLAYSSASVVLALGMLLELPGFYAEAIDRSERMTVMGLNPNTLAVLMAIAIIMLIGLRLNSVFRHFMSKTLLVTMTLPLLLVLVRTGSRTGIGILAIGVLVYMLPQRRAKRGPTSMVLAVLVLGVLGYMASNSSVASRLGDALEGRTGRERIFATSFEMIEERPLLGWRPIVFWYELGERLGEVGGTRDAHNLYLHLLLEVGVVGAVPFLIGLYLCGGAAWKGREGNLGLLPIALLLAVLAANMSHTDLERKPVWLTFAIAIAAGSQRVKKQEQQQFNIPSMNRSFPRRSLPVSVGEGYAGVLRREQDEKIIAKLTAISRRWGTAHPLHI